MKRHPGIKLSVDSESLFALLGPIMTAIKRLRNLNRAGVLAARTEEDSKPQFLRYNLIYGFNGSGKSTLSRIFARMQAGKRCETLPEGCTFELEMDDGGIYSSPNKLSGIEQSICVFNTDFVEQNLRWSEGTANSIFYISKEQADAAAALRAKEGERPLAILNLATKRDLLKEKHKTFGALKREMAKAVAGKLHLGSRRYEAPNLQADYEGLNYGKESILTPQALDDFENVARASSPPPLLEPLKFSETQLRVITRSATGVAAVSVGSLMVEELTAHPAMVPWAKAGLEYHEANKLGSCVFCGNELNRERKALLAAAFDDRLSELMDEIESGEREAVAFFDSIASLPARLNYRDVAPPLQGPMTTAIESLAARIDALRDLKEEIARVYRERQKTPTKPVEHALPPDEDVESICKQIRLSIEELNRVIKQHNDASADFAKLQTDARRSITQHFLAEGAQEFQEKSTGVSDAELEVDAAESALSVLETEIRALRQKVRTHGPAADKITKLIRAYLGHGELAVVAAENGYELHRNGRLVKGPPSEGEQTAIALCYFLTTLEADGRELKNLIIVVDDPISSLDTKAMNYACALVLGYLRSAAQLFVFTHNQHCMNEFKKAWKHQAYPRKADSMPTATLLFLDVRIPEDGSARSTRLIEMSKLLREYDSEYHFLCYKVLEFEKAGFGHSEYGFMMPNVIRRVLELFLAFKVPGSGPMKDKLSELCKRHPDLDPVRITALERLSQVESHSDNLDDLIAHSSMTIEEARDANGALLMLMETADEMHAKLIRKHCAA